MKLHFWPFLKLQKMELGKKIVILIYLVSRVFFGLDIFKFSGSMCANQLYKSKCQGRKKLFNLFFKNCINFFYRERLIIVQDQVAFFLPLIFSTITTNLERLHELPTQRPKIQLLKKQSQMLVLIGPPSTIPNQTLTLPNLRFVKIYVRV